MSLLDDALEAIRKERQSALARGVELLGVVGSVARGDDGAESDVDIAYRLKGRASLLGIARAMLNLKADIGRAVDLIDLDHADQELRAEFERDLVRA